MWKALQIQAFLTVLFLRFCPLFPSPLPLAAFHPVCSTNRTVKRVVFRRHKQLFALPAPPLSDRWIGEQGGAQTGIQREDGGTEPAAHKRIGDALRTNTRLAAVQQQAAPAVVIATAMYQPSGCPVLLIVHVENHTLSFPSGSLI